ncbi:hypothetical protein [Pseudoalteromonas sp. NC201]|uniref:hypothetical protein n=1 Tax=Pseudoalteromonas sp. NC201 TaxID=1514074 RepID=UPI000C7ACDC7|nr:hypothetical protein [Pseudoalteromonas sp. NC201]AUJ69933.1 hypothetical protein PNC201_08195 [Pseudoalteromonas sp. NC201]
MWGKILAGAAVGVGAVAAAPFTGGGSLLGGASVIASLTGAGTVAAAVGAGTVGGVVGAAMADSEENEKRQLKEKGRAEGRAESAIQIEKLANKLSQALEKLKSHDEHFKAIIAMEAVGVACAACDGDFSDNEREEIGEFVKGMMAQSIPSDVKERIQSIYDNPPSVEEAFLLAKTSGMSLDVYEELIRFVMEIDGIKPEEEVFVQAWNQLKAA